MANLGGFNANNVPESSFEPLPAGEYTCQIIASEMKDNSAGTGQYLELRVQVLDDEFQGRLLFERLNLIHPNETAVKIANRTLADICLAVEVPEPEESEELHGIPFLAKVSVTPPRGDWGPGNEIKKYMSVDS